MEGSYQPCRWILARTRVHALVRQVDPKISRRIFLGISPGIFLGIFLFCLRRVQPRRKVLDEGHGPACVPVGGVRVRVRFRVGFRVSSRV